VQCFHCSLPVPAGSGFGVDYQGVRRAVCCPGCEAVAQAILDGGFDGYYRLRSETPQRPAAAGDLYEDLRREDLRIYDDPAVQSRFVRDGAAHGGVGREAELLVEGLRCAACAWLVEQTLARQPGVRSAEVVLATRRARVQWDEGVTPLSALLAAVRRVGYRAWPYERGRLELLDRNERRDALWRLFVAGFGMMQVMMYAFPVYIADAGSMSADVEQLLRWAGLVLTLPVVLYSAAPFFRGAWRDLRALRPGMDVPVALGVAAAFGASAWSTLAGRGQVYFDSIAMFVFLLLAGRYLELLARQRAGRSLSALARLVPETAHRLDAAGNLETVCAALLAPGERVLVRPGETLPADGLAEGQGATVNESLLTGESRPVRRAPGSALLGGSINAGDVIAMRVTRVGAETALASIARLAQNALAGRPRWVAAADRAASVFVVGVLVAAAATFATWWTLDSARALWVAVSVLIVTCPCALSLATPVALTAAVGEMARRGLVVTRPQAVENLARITDVVFDKTGTLTTGRLALLETRTFGALDAENSLALAVAAEQGSDHPLARALRAAMASALRAAAGTQPLPPAEQFRNQPNRGVEAMVQGRRCRVGTAAFVRELNGKAAPPARLSSSDPVVWVGDDAGWIAAFRLGDEARADARSTIAALQGMGMRVHLLSGDSAGVVQCVAGELGIGQVRGGASPEDKLDYVRRLQQDGGRVAMVGDGVNDAPVLAQADMSVALAGGADLAQLKAHAVLMSDKLAVLPGAMALARRTRSVIGQNLTWALGYNFIVLPLAFCGAVTPVAAGIGMSASSLLVVLNALRLRLSAQVHATEQPAGKEA
jgi:Cu2+-exporting ATPase